MCVFLFVHTAVLLYIRTAVHIFLYVYLSESCIS